MTATDLYERPATLPEALKILAEGSWRVAAGCTDLFPATERKVLPGPVLDITAIKALRGITQTDAGIRIGATTTWSDLILADLPPAFDGLKLAAREVGAVQIQNRGTLAGNLCNASPAADGVPPLVTLDAQIELASHTGPRTVPLPEFIKGPRHIDLQPSELVSAIIIPQSATDGFSHFRKLGARDYLVISIAMTAVRVVVQNDIVTQIALSVGSCGPVATRLPQIEAAMTGRRLSVDAIQDEAVAAALSPIDDIRADAAYRSHAAAEVLRRTVQDLIDRGV